jgi:hypothetical protein
MSGRPDLIAAVTTDQNGVFRVAHVQGFMYGQIDAEGYARRWVTELKPGTGATITLDNKTRVRGTVVDGEGKPAAGTEIMLETTRPWSWVPDRPLDHLQVTVQTDEKGGFETLVEAGEYELFATGKGGLFARMPKLQVKEGQTLEQAVRLAPGAHLRVKAVNTLTGKPVAGAKFVIWKELPGVILPAPGTERTTDAEGIAEWESVMPGRQGVENMSPEFARWGSPMEPEEPWDPDGLNNQAMRLDLKAGMGEVLVKMEPAMHVTGKVVDKGGKAVAGVYVNVEGFQTGDRRYMRRTDEKGAYELWVPGKWINGGMYHVVVAKESNYREPEAKGPEFAPKPGGAAAFTITVE